MSLPSQTGRSGGFRTARFSVSRPHRRNPLKKLLPILFLIALLAVLYLVWPDGSPSNPTTDPTTPDQTAAADTQPPPDNATTPAAAGPLTRRPAAATTPPAANSIAMGDDNAADIPTTDQAFNTPTPTNTTTTDDTPATTPAESTEPEPQTPESPRPAPTNTVRADSPVAALVAEATGAMQDGRIIAAREILNRALHHQNALPDDRASIRESLADIAREVTFSPRVVPGDPMARRYTVQPGDSLSKIAAAEGVRTDWRFIQRINDIDRPTAIRVGQTLKLVQGPFHARIDKSDYRLDLFADERDADGNPIYLRSFPVGLGEYDSTPTGNWIVKNRELNPAWVNPRDPSERYARNDPDNPIGNHWIGLTGTDPDNREEWGIGIHGTAEPETIGTQASMGCVRMLEDHVSLCFETLTPERSRVVITD